MERSFKRELRAGLSSPITARSCVFQDGSRATCGASSFVTSANDGADDSAGAASWASPLPVASAASAASAAFSAAAASFSVAASGGNAAQVHAFDVLQAAVATPAARGLAARLNDVMGFPTWAQQLGGACPMDLQVRSSLDLTVHIHSLDRAWPRWVPARDRVRDRVLGWHSPPK